MTFPLFFLALNSIKNCSFRQALSQLQTANDRLEKDVEQEKRLLEERKELVDNLSHEMKTPLGVIRAYADGLLDEPDEKKRLKYADVIITEAERMSCLITTLLDLSALENGATRLHTERFDFVEFVETVAGRLLMDVPDADYELQYELPEQPVMVDMDKGRIEQVLNNLLVNAKRNVCPGGVLNLSLKENNGMLNFSIYVYSIYRKGADFMWNGFFGLLKKDFGLMLSGRLFLLTLGSLVLYCCYINFVYVKLDQKIYPVYLYDPQNTQSVASHYATRVDSRKALEEACADRYAVGIDLSAGKPEVIGVNDKNMKNRREITAEFLFFELCAVGFLGLASMLFKEKQMGVIRVHGILPVRRSMFIFSKLLVLLLSDLLFTVLLTCINLGFLHAPEVLPAVLVQAGILSLLIPR